MNTSNFFSRSDLGGIPEGDFLESLKEANKNQRRIKSVKAKFTCDSVIPSPFGNSNTVHFHAVYGTEGENADYSKATPCGNLSMMIDKDTPAADFFEQGKNYYLTFEAV